MTTERRALPGRGVRSLAAGLALAFTVATHAEAVPINLNLAKPDIGSAMITTSYDASSDTLSASGTAITLTNAANVTSAITSGSFILSASVDATGSASGGSLTITGTTASLSPSPLLTGILLTVPQAQALGFSSNFGFSPPPSDSAILEFVFAVTGGSAAPLYVDPFAGVILSQVSGFTGFTTNWRSNNQGVSDTGMVPVPAAAWLFGTGLVALTTVARRRRGKA